MVDGCLQELYSHAQVRTVGDAFLLKERIEAIDAQTARLRRGYRGACQVYDSSSRRLAHSRLDAHLASLSNMRRGLLFGSVVHASSHHYWLWCGSPHQGQAAVAAGGLSLDCLQCCHHTVTSPAASCDFGNSPVVARIPLCSACSALPACHRRIWLLRAPRRPMLQHPHTRLPPCVLRRRGAECARLPSSLARIIR